MILRLHPQDPAFERMDELVFWNHVLTNPTLWRVEEDPLDINVGLAEIFTKQLELIENDYG